MKKDIAVIITSDLGLRKQYLEFRNKMKRVVGLIFSSVKNRSVRVISKLNVLNLSDCI